MVYQYRTVLTEEERAQFRGLVGSGIAPVRTLTRARILLTANHGPGWSDVAIVGALDVNPSTVLRVRRWFVQEGLATAVARTRPDRDRTLDGAAEARVLGTPPDGQARWSLRLLADAVVRLEVVEAIPHETVHQTLKTTG
jgi:hypothetical protein